MRGSEPRYTHDQGCFGTGELSVTLTSDSDDRAAVAYRLGPEEGSSNEVVTAGISGSPSIAPATFVASGLAAGDPAQTSVSGLVLDNANHPVPGVTLGLANTTLRTQTDDSGFFSLTGTPVGTLLLEVDGTTTTLPGAWPELEFELTTIPGRDNGLGTPIYLLPLDVAGGLQVSDVDEISKIKSARAEQILFDIANGNLKVANQRTQRIRALRHLGNRGWTYDELNEQEIDQRLLYRAGFYPDWAGPKIEGSPCTTDRSHDR